MVTLCAAAADEAIRVVVDQPLVDADGNVDDDFEWPAGVRFAGLGVAGDAYKSASAPGGGYQLDEFTTTDLFAITSTLVRRYEPFYNPARAVGGMVG
jgi:hypothetical protein